jgi:hypothetical protein
MSASDRTLTSSSVRESEQRVGANLTVDSVTGTWINLSNAITVRSLERAGVRVGGNISPGRLVECIHQPLLILWQENASNLQT